jgi:hypothetical protein
MGFISNMNNYPPGVTGNEPEITGEYDIDEDPTIRCQRCGGETFHPIWGHDDHCEEIAEENERLAGEECREVAVHDDLP